MSAVTHGVRRLLREVGDATTRPTWASLPTLTLDALAADNPAETRAKLVELAAAAIAWAEQIDEQAAEAAA